MTRILLISDIHANVVALDAVLDHAGEYDALWCLGDVVGYGPAPNECIERLRGLEPICLAGNHDWAVLDRLDVSEFTPDARRALLWTRGILKETNREWLERLPERRIFREHDITLVHGSPRQPIWEYILSASIAAENMDYFDTLICFYGHTHVPITFVAEPGGRVHAARLPQQNSLLLRDKVLLNPGSVGQPRDGNPRAAYAILELETHTVTHQRVPYDIAATQAAMIQARLPRRLVERLEYGM